MAKAARDTTGSAQRGGETTGNTRRCIVSGEVSPRERLVRFVVGPGRRLVPDIAATLPGRGIWLSARRDVINTACARGLFQRSAKAEVVIGDNLADQVERLLAGRCLDLLGLARRAGMVAAGSEKVTAMLVAGKAAVLVTALESAEGGRAKLRALAPDLPLIDLFTGEELAAALGRGHVMHVALGRGRLAGRFQVEAGRLAGLRSGAAPAVRESTAGELV
ncbi:MAG: RNA-binding protein [Proteobacteria bacterium]|nr:RNA-binding protein [Pseudomonadota bacterium]